MTRNRPTLTIVKPPGILTALNCIGLNVTRGSGRGFSSRMTGRFSGFCSRHHTDHRL